MGFNHNLYPPAGNFTAGIFEVVGSFTTDSAGNVASVSGLDGVAVSGTNLASGVYTLSLGTGATDVGTAFGFTGPSQTAANKIGKPLTLDTWYQVLYASSEVFQDATVPITWTTQTTRKDGPASTVTIQLLKISGSGVPAAAPFASGKVQVLIKGTYHLPPTATGNIF